MKRTLVLIYGLFCYVVFLGTFLYAIAFLGNIGGVKSIDSGSSDNVVRAVMIDAALLLLFSLQHSGMARGEFKRWVYSWIPKAAERSTYTLLSSAALALVFTLWQPIGGEIWSVESSLWRSLLWGVFASGWLLVLISTFLINHFDLFGVRQAWLYFRKRRYAPPKFSTPFLYRIVRHPLYVGWILVFWFTPTMSVAHLLFAVACTAYILIALRLEEQDLLAAHPEYAEYRRRVPMLVPRLPS